MFIIVYIYLSISDYNIFIELNKIYRICNEFCLNFFFFLVINSLIVLILLSNICCLNNEEFN